MLFASAAFLFLFLPAALGIYSLVPVKFKKYALLGISVSYYILANIKTPLAVAVLALTAALTIAAGRYISKRGSGAAFYAVITLIAMAFLAFRVVWETSYSNRGFPLGVAVFLLSAVSYLFDIKRNDAPPGSIADAALYLTFFPVIAAGPVVRYKDFRKYTEEISFSLDSFADGTRRFMAGFVCYITFSAVLTEVYERIIRSNEYSIYIPFGILAAIIIALSSFFAVAGWTFMAEGISLMFGIKLTHDCDLAVTAKTPARYFSGIFKGLGLWIDDYLLSALSHSGQNSNNSRTRAALLASVKVILLGLWLRSTTAVLFAAGIAAVFVFLFYITGAEDLFCKKKYLRPLGLLLTGVLAALFWASTTVEGFGGLVSLATRLTLTAADYMTSYIFITLSGWKYFTVIISSFLLVPLFFYGKTALQRVPGVLRYQVEVIASLILIFIFAFSLVFFMPRFPQYAVRVFEYLAF